MKKYVLLLLLLCFFPSARSMQGSIITLGGDVTEIVFALGAGDKVIARDTTSEHPPQVTQLPDVGYLRLLNAEGLLSLQPSLILASELAYPSAVLSQISAAGIPVVTVSAAAELPAITAKVRQIAETLALQSAAAELVADINRKLDAVPQTPLPVNVLFLLSHAGTAPMAAGTDTAADSLIRSAGGRNAAASFRRYRPLSAEGMIAAQPDLVVITRSGLASLGNTGNLWQLPGLAQTPAGKHKRVLVADDMGFLGFGLQTPDTLHQLREAMEAAAVL
ncbi:heme/hemin ABC transporter substrate-binding protein [Morganella morganii]|uniref:heme/hemin ABC transporter substrate-binding protein n=1 Tax=Morganella morganii TaxID=582 RepID=UPI00041F3B29|nr:ABC transporter substrate-binding protein [Morganella morganii]EKW3935980.1 ABC transporter substrate-binding protein [Morganella morganii]EKW3938623.1 ABC transporter substrate-binding protein [Morganella morganii]HBN5912371.1 ABC transporter substrate-binding protein [Morganella morganii]HCR3330826.1 ABC transporter substrate-binding protein [Morganella morganii]HCR4009305.1 ABC transporter substrate-binding protein [Morganella morganii]